MEIVRSTELPAASINNKVTSTSWFGRLPWLPVTVLHALVVNFTGNPAYQFSLTL
jgi:hypothetical protein